MGGDSRALAWSFVGLFFLALNGIGVRHWMAGGEASGGLRLILIPLAIIVFWRLLETECRPYRIAFPMDMGFLLYVSSFLALPYYLWRTQRWRGVLKLFWIAALWAGTYALWAVVASVLASQAEAPAGQGAGLPGGRPATEQTSTDPSPHITLSELEVMFGQMRDQPGLNVDGPLLWGYFFTDRDESKLKPLAGHLASLGYRVVGVYPTEDRSTNFLHVEKVETHTPRSLHERNASFYGLAEWFGVETYDGMDVGLPDPKP